MDLNRMKSIGKFSDVIRNFDRKARYQGLDKEGNPVFDKAMKLPLIEATGTVKIHGTNAGVSFNFSEGMWAQSKKNVITPEKDNAGFAFWVKSREQVLLGMFEQIFDHYNLSNNVTATVFGEWAGKGVQGKVAVSELDKKFYIFGIKIKPKENDVPSYWVDNSFLDVSAFDDIYNIQDFKTFNVIIDFENPAEANNKMVEEVKKVEAECPVGKHLGVSGLGEGIVFKFNYGDELFIWKMKGDKHAGKSKVKKAKKVDLEKVSLIQNVVEEVTPLWRLKQMYDEFFDTINGGVGDIKQTGDYIRAVLADIRKEDSDVIADNGLEPKDVNRDISMIARRYLMERLDEEVGL